MGKAVAPSRFARRLSAYKVPVQTFIPRLPTAVDTSIPSQLRLVVRRISLVRVARWWGGMAEPGVMVACECLLPPPCQNKSSLSSDFLPLSRHAHVFLSSYPSTFAMSCGWPMLVSFFLFSFLFFLYYSPRRLVSFLLCSSLTQQSLAGKHRMALPRNPSCKNFQHCI